MARPRGARDNRRALHDRAHGRVRSPRTLACEAPALPASLGSIPRREPTRAHLTVPRRSVFGRLNRPGSAAKPRGNADREAGPAGEATDGLDQPVDALWLHAAACGEMCRRGFAPPARLRPILLGAPAPTASPTHPRRPVRLAPRCCGVGCPPRARRAPIEPAFGPGGSPSTSSRRHQQPTVARSVQPGGTSRATRGGRHPRSIPSRRSRRRSSRAATSSGGARSATRASWCPDGRPGARMVAQLRAAPSRCARSRAGEHAPPRSALIRSRRQALCHGGSSRPGPASVSSGRCRR